jgi:hypothetical protein
MTHSALHYKGSGTAFGQSVVSPSSPLSTTCTMPSCKSSDTPGFYSTFFASGFRAVMRHAAKARSRSHSHSQAQSHPTPARQLSCPNTPLSASNSASRSTFTSVATATDKKPHRLMKQRRNSEMSGTINQRRLGHRRAYSLTADPSKRQSFLEFPTVDQKLKPVKKERRKTESHSGVFPAPYRRYSALPLLRNVPKTQKLPQRSPKAAVRTL